MRTVKKRALSLLLAMALSLGLAVPAMAAESSFTDVNPNAYYAEAVAWAVENNITVGTGKTTFSPDKACTRAQIITFLWRSVGSPAVSVTGGVSDIAESDYFYQAVLWAKEMGLFEGDSFQPNEPCTRLMAVEFMWKKSGSLNVTGNRFSDVDSAAVNWAVYVGITSGTGKTTFSPDSVCTRGQIVTLLWRAYAPRYEGSIWNERFGSYYFYNEENDKNNRLFKVVIEQIGTMISATVYGFHPRYFDDWDRYAWRMGNTITIDMFLENHPFNIKFYDGYLMLDTKSSPYMDGKYVHEKFTDIDYEQIVKNG